MANTRTPCCDYEIPVTDKGPIYWNPYNEVVQCHNCGEPFSIIPKGYKVVPVHPTKEMTWPVEEYLPRVDPNAAALTWQIMLAAAPEVGE